MDVPVSFQTSFIFFPFLKINLKIFDDDYMIDQCGKDRQAG